MFHPDFDDKNREQFEISEARAFLNFELKDMHMITYVRKRHEWRIIGDFRGCYIGSLIGRKFMKAIEGGYRKNGVIYICDNEIKCVFMVHVFY